MFPNLRSEINARFSRAEQLFRATGVFKGDLASAAKGLAFVQLYAVYEFTVRSIVRAAIDSINAHGHKMKDIAPSLTSLYLDPELMALRDRGLTRVWEQRLRLFDRAFSADVVNLSNDTSPPTDGSHYRHSHLLMIFKVFGITRLPVRRRRHLYRIDEVVDNRNKVAHGKETAEDIGRRYTRADIAHIAKQMESVCVLLVSIFDGYCADASRHKRK